MFSIQNKRNTKDILLAQLKEGEIGFATDTNELVVVLPDGIKTIAFNGVNELENKLSDYTRFLVSNIAEVQKRLEDNSFVLDEYKRETETLYNSVSDRLTIELDQVINALNSLSIPQLRDNLAVLEALVTQHKTDLDLVSKDLAKQIESKTDITKHEKEIATLKKLIEKSTKDKITLDDLNNRIVPEFAHVSHKHKIKDVQGLSEALAVAGGSITVKEEDDTPSYSNITTIVFPSATLAQPAANTVSVLFPPTLSITDDGAFDEYDIERLTITGATLSVVDDGHVGIAITGSAGDDAEGVIYVSKTGNDSNSGLNIAVPKLTIGGAITAAGNGATNGTGAVPSATNIILIKVLDSARYDEEISVPSYVIIAAENAESYVTTGINILLSDHSVAVFDRITNAKTSGDILTASCIVKASGSSVSKAYAREVYAGEGGVGVLNYGTDSQLFTRVEKMVVPASSYGVYVGDGGAGHIHAYIGNIYLNGDNSIGIWASGDVTFGGTIVGHVEHILSTGGSSGRTAVFANGSDTTPRIDMSIDEIGTGIDTAVSVQFGTVNLTVGRMVGDISVSSGATLNIQCAQHVSGSVSNSGTLIGDIGKNYYGDVLLVDGKLGVNNGSPSGMVDIVSPSDTIGFILKGSSSQTTDYFKITDVSDSSVFYVDEVGETVTSLSYDASVDAPSGNYSPSSIYSTLQLVNDGNYGNNTSAANFQLDIRVGSSRTTYGVIAGAAYRGGGQNHNYVAGGNFAVYVESTSEEVVSNAVGGLFSVANASSRAAYADNIIAGDFEIIVGCNRSVTATSATFLNIRPVSESNTNMAISTVYGIKIADQDVGTTNYAIYTGAGSIVFNSGGDAATDFTVKTDTYDAIVVDASADAFYIMTNASGKVSFFGASPVTQSTGWSTSNVTTDKSFDANATTLDELADVVGTLVEQLKTYGLLGS